jgi:RHS repeat-associated protein
VWVDNCIVITNALDQTSLTVYDDISRSIIHVVSGVVERTIYNDLGLPEQIIQDYGGLNATTFLSYDSGLNATTFLSYDSGLNLVSVVDANGNQTRYTYTPRGAVALESYADGTTVAYAYDPRGNLAVQTLQDGQAITHTYDALGRMTTANQTLSGHATTLAYAYNAIGDVVSTTQALDGTGWQVDYGYDYTGGTFTTTYPSGVRRVRTLDAINRLDTVREGDGSLVADYDYHDADHYNALAYPTGLTTHIAYDTLGRTTQVSSTVADYRYGYDAVGNRTYAQRYHQPGQPADVYQYDALYQLTHAWYGADSTDPGSITAYDRLQWYDLDTLGNRLEVQDDGASQTYLPNDGEQSTDPMNRYQTVAGNPLTYDPRGNTLTDAANTYAYDVLNRQTGVTGTTSTAEYLYDARGRRIARVVDGITTTHYIYDTQYRVLEERDGDGDLLARYTYGTGMDEPLTMERDGNTYYYHRDALGSITEVTDESGVIVERYEYDVYGAVTIYDSSDVTITTSAIANPYLFTARRYDPESGNYYYRARYYSPALGRFLSQDPLGFEAGDYNLYRYAFNNPTNLTDPSGEIVVSAAIGALIVVMKIVDYAWTAWDLRQSSLVLKDRCASGEEKLLAGLNIALAIVFEAVEPDDLLPIAVPADDVGRKMAVKAAREGLEEAGMEGFEQTIRRSVGDDLAEQVFRQMDLEDDLAGNLPIGWTGDIGEEVLRKLGGQSQVSKNTSLGRRVIDQLVDGVAHESKVGYTSLTQKGVQRQVAKDAELIATREIEGAVWHFFTSPVTGKGGPSGPLARELGKAGIQIIIH